MPDPQPRHASPDGLTRWWRSVSLRSKVTGVTVGVLVIGLFATGLGTMVFLRTTLLANLDTTLTPLTSGNVAANALLDTEVTASGLVFSPRDDVAPTDYSVAIYNASGDLVLTAGGEASETDPVFPDTFALDYAYAHPLEAFELEGEPSGSYRAMAIVTQFDGNPFFTQVVAIPTAETERVVGTYLGIYTLLALVVVIASAILVRWVVTLTFRSLTQVERTADAIAGGDFSLRLTDLEPETTEVGRLKRAINAMLGRIDASLSQRDATVRQMRRFIGDASHELRTPLVTVRGYAELYRMGAIPDAEATAQAMERIEKEAMRMTTMVEDLLALARLDERRGIVPAPVDLRPIARDAAMDVRAAAPQRRITVIDTTGDVRPVMHAPPIVLPPTEPLPTSRRRGPVPTAAINLASRLRRRPRGDGTGETGEVPTLPVRFTSTALPPIVMADENSVRQVVANLLGNAQRYSPDDAPIELRVGVDDTRHMGWIEIADHGDGVPEQIRDQIFQRFWRADTSRTRDTGGSGLGLSIVASLVDALHGTVTVGDTEGGGASFRVSFPLAIDEDAAAQLLRDTQPLTPLELDGA
ncbi:MAG: HAMP domain-containing sensor histidine kinase [Microbacterium sp.]|uniref:sensor histidine kinase n=1 Tax=Microbacterium sp. TaxID=51671 RepID=UPI002624DA99|nr:HAMP domain-containing sensor histidine kinase [Microbacterium sp.]MCX6503474.1 HAMP domain-containing sensor histidine kinase [Microbacterium sp.]